MRRSADMVVCLSGSCDRVAIRVGLWVVPGTHSDDAGSD